MLRPSARARRRLLFAALWPALGLAFSTSALLADLMAPPGAPPTWPSFALWNVQYFAVCGLLALGVERLRRRMPLVGGRRRNLYLHVAASLGFALLHTGLTAGLIALENPLFRGGPRFRIDFAHGFPVFLHHELLFYWLILGAGEAIAYDRRLRGERAVREALERELAEARLAALRMQLHPHFLFNALNAVAELLHADPAAASRMLEALERLLDAAVGSARRPLTPLADELELLERYLDIERVRFGRDLALTVALDGDAPRALVPTLLLQPLVENALRHGRRAAEGAPVVQFAAARDGGLLRLELVNELPEGAAAAPRAGGVGLANCRERLARLFGDAGRLDAAADVAAGRFRVVVELPFTVAAPAEADEGAALAVGLAAGGAA